jgi:hypothetical protein
MARVVLRNRDAMPGKLSDQWAEERRMIALEQLFRALFIHADRSECLSCLWQRSEAAKRIPHGRRQRRFLPMCPGASFQCFFRSTSISLIMRNLRC